MPASPVDLVVPFAAKTLIKKTSGGGNKKGTSAERRATHNTVERRRRDDLNTRFLLLADKLPPTDAARKTSKSSIVERSLDFVERALVLDTVLRLKVEQLLHENINFMTELNDLRQERGLSPHISSVDPSMPLELAKTVYKVPVAKQSRDRGSISVSLGGDLDDGDISLHADNTSLGSSSSPSDILQCTDLPDASYEPSPGSSDHANQYYMDTLQPFHQVQHLQQPHPHSQPQQHDGGFATSQSYIFRDYAAQAHQQHHPLPPQESTLDFLTAITPTTAAMFSQMIGNACPPSSLAVGLNDLPINGGHHHHHHDSFHDNSPMEDNHANSHFASLASQAFFDQRYPNPIPASTPTPNSYLTTA
ncbi:hypothetical protein CBS101457_006217 [Exobasidium rhododendri]|nr:hypothetical protein CBS101457_006217 [Exobasidium rhododendri]